MAKQAATQARDFKPGTKGHVLAFGSEGNTFTFDLDEDGGVINLRPTDDNGEVAKTESDVEA